MEGYKTRNTGQPKLARLVGFMRCKMKKQFISISLYSLMLVLCCPNITVWIETIFYGCICLGFLQIWKVRGAK